MLVEGLRRGDQQVFTDVVQRHASAMLRVARTHVRSRAVAEEVVQETWLRVIRGIDRFEARSSLKVWIFRILTNVAMTRARREGRSAPFTDLRREPPVDGSVEPAERFLSSGHGQRAGSWATPLHRWPDESPTERLYARETRARLRGAIQALPPKQRIVLVLVDVEGWNTHEVCAALEISPQNQRTLLHRGRARLRRSLEAYLEREAE